VQKVLNNRIVLTALLRCERFKCRSTRKRKITITYQIL